VRMGFLVLDAVASGDERALREALAEAEPARPIG
jgi:hypothetical protein